MGKKSHNSRRKNKKKTTTKAKQNEKEEAVKNQGGEKKNENERSNSTTEVHIQAHNFVIVYTIIAQAYLFLDGRTVDRCVFSFSFYLHMCVFMCASFIQGNDRKAWRSHKPKHVRGRTNAHHQAVFIVLSLIHRMENEVKIVTVAQRQVK